jgi:hypothetical protein
MTKAVYCVFSVGLHMKMRSAVNTLRGDLASLTAHDAASVHICAAYLEHRHGVQFHLILCVYYARSSETDCS